MQSLTTADPGKTMMIRKISGNPETRKFLENLGFVPGSEVTVISKIGEDVIVKIKESKIAVSSKMAAKVMI